MLPGVLHINLQAGEVAALFTKQETQSQLAP